MSNAGATNAGTASRVWMKPANDYSTHRCLMACLANAQTVCAKDCNRQGCTLRIASPSIQHCAESFIRHLPQIAERQMYFDASARCGLKSVGAPCVVAIVIDHRAASSNAVIEKCARQAVASRWRIDSRG